MSPGVIFMPDGHVFGHISLAHHLTLVLVSWTPRVADEERSRLLGGVAVIVSTDLPHPVGRARIADHRIGDLSARSGEPR
jgi:hypothetical protein